MPRDFPIEVRFISTLAPGLISVAAIPHAEQLIVQMVTSLIILNGAVNIANDAAPR